MVRLIWKDLYTKTERDLVHTPVSLPTPPQKPHTLQTNLFCYCRCHTSVKGRLWGLQNGTLVFCRYLTYAPRVVLYSKLCWHKVWAHALCSVSFVNSGRYYYSLVFVHSQCAGHLRSYCVLVSSSLIEARSLNVHWPSIRGLFLERPGDFCGREGHF